jgi:heme exporter protein A
MTSPLLDITDVTCEREGRELFAHLSLQVYPGTCVELTGPNGSGKSTLLRCITGLFPDYEGSIVVAQMLYLGHKPGVSSLLTPIENLRWYQALTDSDHSAADALARVGLRGYEEVRCQNLSAGQHRRVSLARLLVCQAPLWLLDEPFTALDDGGRELVRELLVAHCAQGGAVVCATHQALGVADTQALRLGGP